MEGRVHPQVTIEGPSVSVRHLTVDDPVLAGLLATRPEDDRPAVVERALVVGARGLATMGLGLDLAEVDARVARTVERVTDEAAAEVEAMLAEARRAMAATLDPDQRTSLVARIVSDFGAWRDRFLTALDPDVQGSHTGSLLVRLGELLGPGGALEQRLEEALDPSSDGSALARLTALVDRRFLEMRELLAEQRGRSAEAERGTAKGFDFEDLVEERLREAARSMGAIVERTSRTSGSLAGEAVVGDFLVTTPEGARIVVEAKNARSVSLTGADGILAVLDRAMANRTADAALCISAQDAFPREVGPFASYGNRVLVVDDEGAMVEPALRFAAAVATHPTGAEIDLRLIDDKLQRIRQTCSRLSAHRRSLTEIAGSVDKVKGSLDDMRSELLDLVSDLEAELRRSPGGEVLEIRRQAG